MNQNLLGLTDQRAHFSELCGLVRERLLGCGLNVRGKAGKTREKEHEILIQRALPLGAHNHGAHAVAVFAEANHIEAAKGSGNLVLPAAGLPAEFPLEVNGLVREALLVGVLSLQRIEGVQHADRKTRARAESRARRQIRLIG